MNCSIKSETRTANAVRDELPPSEHHQLNWRGIKVGIAYRKHTVQRSYAHLEVHSEPGTVLPIDETGYRANLLPIEEIERTGGPVTYVRMWLDKAAQSKAWRQIEADSRQGQLF